MTQNWYDKFKAYLPDPIMNVNLEYISDKRPNKINAGVGMIMDPQSGKPFVPTAIRKIGKEIAFENNAYLPSEGHLGYLYSHASELVFSSDIWKGFYQKHKIDYRPESVVWAQTIGGTKAINLTAKLISLSIPPNERNLLLDSGWPNYFKIFHDCNITTYVHEDPITRKYNHELYIKTLKGQPKDSIVVLQACGYNDDGSDRSTKQWDEIIDILVDQNNLVVVDFAYNGLVNGWQVDNYPVIKLAISGLISFICVSNSKNVSYNSRLGSLYIINLKKDVADNIQGNLSNLIIRSDYSNPNAFPAQTMSVIFHDQTLLKLYKAEIDDVRQTLLFANRVNLSESLGSGYEWIENKRRLYLKLLSGGFNQNQMSFLKDQAIHGPKSSRLNMGGFDPKKMGQIAKIYKHALSL